ncbi:MAG: DUF3618 domain-containing protein [Inquilinaceae bacterium]
MSDTDRTPEEIERDIDRTRAHMDSTISQIQDKLSPGQLMDEALNYFQDGPGEFGRNLGRAVRDNPMPVALLGLGAAWLMISGSSRRDDDYAYRAYRRDSEFARWSNRADRFGDDSYGYSEAVGETAGTAGTAYGGSTAYGASDDDSPGIRDRAKLMGERVGDAASSASDRVTGAASAAADRSRTAAAGAAERVRGGAAAVGERAGAMAQAGREHAAHARDRASQAYYQARDGVRRGTAEARYRAREAGSQASEYYDRQPLIFGALAAVVGAGLAMAIPATRREDEMIGPYRDRVRDQAGTAASDLADRAVAIGEKASETARSEAAAQGLTRDDAKQAGRDVGGKLKTVAEKTAKAAEDEAKRQADKGKPDARSSRAS